MKGRMRALPTKYEGLQMILILLVFINSPPILISKNARTLSRVSSTALFVADNGNDITGNGTSEKPYKTIQQAIDVAKNGYQIIVSEGRYTGPGNVNLDFMGKAITVRSKDLSNEASIKATILDAEGRGVIARFITDEGPETVFQGFSLRAGDKTSHARGVPGFFEFSANARPTTKQIYIDSNPNNSLHEKTRPKLPEQAQSNRIWDGLNPFQQPKNTTDYYGSGDVNADGYLSDADIMLADDMSSGNLPLSGRADVDGNGIINQQDKDLISNAILNQLNLPGWWDELSHREQRNTWIDKLLAIDPGNLHAYIDEYACRDFAIQLYINGTNYRGDVHNTWFNGGQKGYNLPMYFVTVYDDEWAYVHAINAILVGDNPLNFDDWRFIEPQTDEEAHPGMWDMPVGTKVSIELLNYAQSAYPYSKPVLIFRAQEAGGILLEKDPQLVLTRPQPVEQVTDNRLDLWSPFILPGEKSKILFESSVDGLTPRSDILIADLDLTDPLSGTSLNLAQNSYSRIMDIFQDSEGIYHLLFLTDTYSLPQLYYARLDPKKSEASDISPVAYPYMIPNVARILVTPQKEVIILWIQQWGPERGIFWTKHTASGWQVKQNLTPGDFDPPGGYSPKSNNDHNPLVYLFDALLSPQGGITLVYTTQLFGGGEYPWWTLPDYSEYVYIKKYDGVWSKSELVGNPPINAYGLDLAYETDGRLNIAYWHGDILDDSKGIRGNLYYISQKDSKWSTPVQIDQSGFAGFPRMIAGGKGELYLVWERLINNRVFPFWGYSKRGSWWFISQVDGVQPDEDVWHPNIYLQSDNQIIITWASRFSDYVSIQKKELSAPKINYLPMIMQEYIFP